MKNSRSYANLTAMELLSQAEIRKVFERLKKANPNPEPELIYKNAYTLLVSVVLSAQATDKSVNKATEPLYKIADSPKKMLALGQEKLEGYIKSIGLYKTKAQSVIGMCRRIVDVYGGKIPDSIEELTTLPGIGRKTANLIMGDVYGQPAIVADTHCIRICGRLGFTTSKDPVKTESELRELIAPEKSSDFCHRLVMFGRETCKARGQRCGECELSGICPSCT